MHVNINIRAPVARLKESDFVVQLLADMLAPNAFTDLSGEPPLDASEEAPVEEEFVVGRLWAERLDWGHAEECGYSIFTICDEASGTWLQVLETLSRNGGLSLRKDLNLEGYISEVVFVHEILIHPDVIDRIAIIDAALKSLSSNSSLLMMYHEQSEPHHLEDWECRDLGFKKIVRSNLLLRDNHLRYPFGDKHPAGRPVEFVATAEHESWLFESWDELILDHPSL